MEILIDTNILIDYLDNRPESENAEKIINLCRDGLVTGYMAAHSISNIFYILRKIFTLNELKELLLNLTDLITIISLDQFKIKKALNNKHFLDFEDCLQSECALEKSADFILTRNVKDFSSSIIPVLTPNEFLNRYF